MFKWYQIINTIFLYIPDLAISGRCDISTCSSALSNIPYIHNVNIVADDYHHREGAHLLENISAKSRSYNLKSLMGWNGTKAPPSSSPASPPSSSPPRPFPLPRPAEAFPPRGSLLSFPLPRPFDFPFEDEASCLPDGAVAPCCVPFVWVSCTRNKRCATSDTSRGFAIEIGMNRVLFKSFVYTH